LPALKEDSASYLDWLSGRTLEFLFSWTGLSVYSFSQVERLLSFAIFLMGISHVVSMFQSQVFWQPHLKAWENFVSTIVATLLSFIVPSMIALDFPNWASVPLLLAIIVIHGYQNYVDNVLDEQFQASRWRHRAVAKKMLLLLALGWIVYAFVR
jgi:hypothetical protein